MAAFETDAELVHSPDFEISRAGGVVMYQSRGVLRAAEHELSQRDYELVRLDATEWQTPRLMHESIAAGLAFPDYYGHNMNALHDCLGDVTRGYYGWNSDNTGLAVTVDSFGAFADRDIELGTAIASALVRASRTGLLFGHRLLWLLQVDNGSLRLGPVGSVDISWNRAEWLDSKRSR